MSDVIAAERNVTPAITSISTWNADDKPAALINAIIRAHFLSCSLPYEARRHIGWLEGKAVQVGLAHAWDWTIVPHGDGVISAWEELKNLRTEAIEMAMRASGCGRYSWEANPDLFQELSGTAPTIQQVVGEALAARDAEMLKEAA